MLESLAVTFVLCAVFRVSTAQIPISPEQLYTITYSEKYEYYPEFSMRKPCAGRMLTYEKHAAAAFAGKVFLNQPGPAFPLVVWRAHAVHGRPGEFTLEAANRTKGATASLAYFTNCAKRGVFLATPGTKGAGFRWKVYSEDKPWIPMKKVIEAAGRRCTGTPKHILGPEAVADGSSCDPPHAGVRLWRDPTGNETDTMRWGLDPFLPYPAKLIGTREPVGAMFSGKSDAFTLADGFGRSLALLGNVMVVGQTKGAYTFRRKPTDAWGVWRRQSLHRPQDATAYFGNAVGVGAGFVAVASSEIYVYAPEKPALNGNVYVYPDKGNRFGSPKALMKPKNASVYFAYGIAVDNVTVAVNDYGLGNIFLYTRAYNGTWGRPHALLPTNTPGCCQAVALAAGTLVTTAPNLDDNVCAPRLDIFTLNGGKWKQHASINHTLSHFCSGVCGGWDCNSLHLSPSGNTLAIEDAVYIRKGTTWTLLQTINSTYDEYTPDEPPGFGVRAISDDVLVDGASIYVNEPDNIAFDSNVWFRESSAGPFIKKARLEVPFLHDLGRWGKLGVTAALSGNFIAVSEPGFDGNQYALPVLGSVYVWDKNLV